MHQMVPDILIGNEAFIEGLNDEEREIFEEGYQLVNKVQREEWVKAVEAAKDKAENEQHVQFLYPDQTPFKEACLPLHETVLAGNPEIQPIYDQIQEYNKQYPGTAEDAEETEAAAEKGSSDTESAAEAQTETESAQETETETEEDT